MNKRSRRSSKWDRSGIRQAKRCWVSESLPGQSKVCCSDVNAGGNGPVSGELKQVAPGASMGAKLGGSVKPGTEAVPLGLLKIKRIPLPVFNSLSSRRVDCHVGIVDCRMKKRCGVSLQGSFCQNSVSVPRSFIRLSFTSAVEWYHQEWSCF